MTTHPPPIHGFWRGVMVLAVLTVGGASAVMNARFGYQLGDDPLSRTTLVIFSVALEVTKWVMPIAASSAWQRAAYVRLTAALILCGVCSVWSFAAAMGFAALNRDTTVAERSASTSERDRATTAYRNAQQTLATLQQHERWQKTAACTNATAPASIAFCAEVATARQAITAAEQRLSAPVTAGTADPQAEFIVRTFGLSLAQAQLVLVLLLAITAEAMSLLGLFAVTVQAAHTAATAKPSQETVEAVSPVVAAPASPEPAKAVLVASQAGPTAPTMKRPPLRPPTASSLRT